MKKCWLMLLLAFVMMPLSVMGQQKNCSSKVSSLDRYQALGNGVVKDHKTKKLWMQCPLGMHWDGQSCEDKSMTYSFAEVSAEVDKQNRDKVAGRSDWRLPSVDELASIVEATCYDPAINLKAFPYTPQSGFWTNTEVAGSTSTRIAIIHFLNGRSYIANKSQNWRVRLVADD